jgi:hypothetical protein
LQALSLQIEISLCATDTPAQISEEIAALDANRTNNGENLHQMDYSIWDEFDWIPERLLEKCIVLIKAAHDRNGEGSIQQILWDKDTMAFIAVHKGTMEMLRLATKSWRPSKRREYGTYLLSLQLAIESLGCDFAGWGSAYAKAKHRADRLLDDCFIQSRTRLLDVYLPLRAELDQYQIVDAFGPISLNDVKHTPVGADRETDLCTIPSEIPSREFAECWRAAGSHLNTKLKEADRVWPPGPYFGWYKADLNPGFLEHLSFRLGNQAFFVRLQDADGKVEGPGTVGGLLRVARGWEGIPCLLPMRRTSGTWRPEFTGWGLIDVQTKHAIDAQRFVSSEAVEMTDWEIHDFAVRIVCASLEKDRIKLSLLNATPKSIRQSGSGIRMALPHGFLSRLIAIQLIQGASPVRRTGRKWDTFAPASRRKCPVAHRRRLKRGGTSLQFSSHELTNRSKGIQSRCCADMDCGTIFMDFLVATLRTSSRSTRTCEFIELRSLRGFKDGLQGLDWAASLGASLG